MHAWAPRRRGPRLTGLGCDPDSRHLVGHLFHSPHSLTFLARLLLILSKLGLLQAPSHARLSAFNFWLGAMFQLERRWLPGRVGLPPATTSHHLPQASSDLRASRDFLRLLHLTVTRVQGNTKTTDSRKCLHGGNRTAPHLFLPLCTAIRKE